jgi:hypothetical protein
MKKIFKLSLFLIAFIVAIGLSTDCFARGGGGHHGGHHGGHGYYGRGAYYIGASPWWNPYPYWYSGYPYAYGPRAGVSVGFGFGV